MSQGYTDCKTFMEAGHLCPICGRDGLLPFGTPGFYWIEHSCGVHTDTKPTLKAALKSIQH